MTARATKRMLPETVTVGNLFLYPFTVHGLTLTKDLDVHARKEKKIRLEDKKFFKSQTADLPKLDIRDRNLLAEELNLAAGRLRMPGFAVYVFLMMWVTVCGADFVVAPTGCDAAEGTIKAPFATIAGAQIAVRRLRANQPDRVVPVVIHLREGIYRITHPVVFSPADSGTRQSPTIYMAYPDEQPVISGGQIISGWRVNAGRWITTLPDVQRGDWRFRQLWVNGRRCFRPRIPPNGYLRIEDKALPTWDADTWQGSHPDRFVFGENDIRANWHNRDDVELLVFHHWSMSRLPVAEVDGKNRIVTLRSRTWHPRHAALHTGKRYIAENVYEAFNNPGEWYLDREKGTLYYIPFEGETLHNTEIIAPRAQQLLLFQGDPEHAVRYIELRGITFEHTLATLPDDGYCVAQAEVGARGTAGKNPLLSAVESVYAQYLTIADCVIRHVGAYAVEFGLSCHDNVIRNCEMWDIGAGGIRAGSNDPYPEGDLRNAMRLTVEDCQIAHGGRMHPGAVGIWVGHSGGNRIIHNTIHDLYYTGISVGWNWSGNYSPAKDNLVTHNHIYNIGQTRLDDLGGIYTLGASAGTVLTHNRIHDITRVAYTGAGIYFDEFTAGITAVNNLVFRTQDGGFVVNHARNNAITNNIFAYRAEFTLNPGRVDAGGPMIFERNIVLWNTGAAYRSHDVRKDFAADRNLYWPEHGDTDNFADNCGFSDWQALGKDIKSIIADPKFYNAKNGDFRLNSNSPAQEIGFRIWNLDDVGRRTRSRFVSENFVPHAFPSAGKSVSVSLDENFALCEPGEIPSALHTQENNDNETVRVTSEASVSGGRSLKFVNGPSKPVWRPNCFWEFDFSEGLLIGKFDLMLKPGAVFVHEWRDTGPGAAYRVGPSIRIAGDGRMVVGDRELMRLPHDQWMNFKIHCGTGAEATGQWALEVRVHGDDVRRFDDLFCSSAFQTS